MKRYYVNVKQEMIFVREVWAEDKEHAVWKVLREGKKVGIGQWNTGKCKAYVQSALKVE